MKPGYPGHALAVLAGALLAGSATAAAGAEAPDSRWQCSPTGASAMAPAVAARASDYLGRVEAIYPNQVLGLVRAGERYYLLNSRDVEWGDRTRLGLLAQRLQAVLGSQVEMTSSSPLAPDAAISSVRAGAAPAPEVDRPAMGALPGGSPPQGGFICLAAARAGREGLAPTPSGEFVLAAGQSVHLVNPQEPEVVVEVRAAPDRGLSLGEIFQRSAQAGIYAGLLARTRQSGAETVPQPSGGILIFRTASVGASAPENRIAAFVTQPSLPAPGERGTPAAADAIAPVDARPPAPEPTVQIAASAASSASVPEAVASPAALVAVPAPAYLPEVPPVPAVALRPDPPARLPAAVAELAGSAAAQPYDDYAKAMKTMMALRRSGSVRSVGEMTYVHPAVEMLRSRNR